MNTDHIIIDGKRNALVCKVCGGFHPFPMPIAIKDLVALGETFRKLHAGCKKKKP